MSSGIVKRTIKRVLIANRGEIALRVIRACRELGLESVAVFSSADRISPFVLAADYAYPIGPPPPGESYLKGELIIERALESGAQAIHPGYGFLAENGQFAQSVSDAGLIWIGPPPEAISAMGSKTEARQLMSNAEVPVIPGSLKPLDNFQQAEEIASKIGYPILIKAAYGGGGKGMKIVRSPQELPSALESAQREALTAFGNGSIYLEKLITAPRHIEVQILSDNHGNTVHLFERECSIQRRHQKVIEESPSPALERYPHLREKIGGAAIAAARACGYRNAGTVEFLFDEQTGEFYFLEMNTRIQVEHPVTEMVTGWDIVHLQIAIAQGEELPFTQQQVSQKGHAIECRIYAEDPETGFLPDSGRIEKLVFPSGPGVRVDSGVAVGEEIGIYYDPMIAKLIVWAPTRLQAIARMRRALEEFVVLGLKTNIPFLRWAMDHPRFVEGDYDTRFIENEYHPERLGEDRENLSPAVVIASALMSNNNYSVTLTGTIQSQSIIPDGVLSPWKRVGRWEAMREG
ncbi:MAG: acetyl/propionyl/methylcrotonyl-CoA carboxylase subunit alpha [bacterium]